MEKIIGKHAGKVRKSIYLQGTFKVHNMNNWQLFFHFIEIYNALWSRFLIMNLKSSGLGLFRNLTFQQKTFGTNISSRDFSAHVNFCVKQLKVSYFQNEFMKIKLLPKNERKIARISALWVRAEILAIFRSFFGRSFIFINSFWN